MKKEIYHIIPDTYVCYYLYTGRQAHTLFNAVLYQTAANKLCWLRNMINSRWSACLSNVPFSTKNLMYFWLWGGSLSKFTWFGGVIENIHYFVNLCLWTDGVSYRSHLT